MGIAICLIDDGRPACLMQSVTSLDQCFPKWPCDKVILTEDAGDAQYSALLQEQYAHLNIQVHHETRRGLAGALRSAWQTALDTGAQYVFHLEADFVLLDRIPISKMIKVLQDNPRLAQVSLKRGPVNDVERAVGGTIECAPHCYTQRDGFVEHQTIFTFNPCLIPRSVIELCLAEPGDGLERGFTDTLLDHGYSFGIFGRIEDPARVEHIGHQRSSGWKV